ncbi:MAG: TonB-dependent receptor [Bacteroidota bacterium]
MRTLLLLLALTTAPASAQSVVNGFVRDARSGETLIGANVIVLDGPAQGRGSATNVQGFYTLGNLPSDSLTLRFSFIGFSSQTQRVGLQPGETLRLDVELAPEGELDEVVVEADEPIEEAAAIGTIDVPIRLVQDLPTAFEADLFRAIQLLPGVKSSSDFSSGLYIRGGSPDQTLILLDGTTVYNPTHFFGFFSTFNTDAIKDVRLYKGAYPATYGGRLGSVIDIYNRDGNRNELDGGLTVGLLASRADIEGPLPGMEGRGSFTLNARRSTLEPLLATLRENLDQDGIPDKFYFYDLNAKVGADLTDRDRVSVAAYAGQDIVGVPFGESSQFNLNYGNRTFSAAYNRILGETTFLQTRATASRYFSLPTAEIFGTEFTNVNTVDDYSGRVDLEWLPSERFELSTGAWAGRFELNFEQSFNGQTQIDFESPSYYANGYVQTKLRPTPDWIVTGGVRAEYFANGDYLRFSPQVQLERKLGTNTILQLAAGQYHQFLSLISNEAFSGFDTWVTVGEGVPPQESEQVVLGLKTRLGDQYRLDVELYGRTLRELFDQRPELQDVSGLEYQELFRFGEGFAYGAEILLEKGVGRLTGLIGYTLGVTRRRYPLEPAFTETFPPKYDRLHDLNVVATFKLGRGWSATAVGKYATGQAYTLPSATYTVPDVPIVDGGRLDGLFSSQLNGARLPPYHRVDLGFKRAGGFFGVAQYELQLQVINVYSRRNVWFPVFDFDSVPVDVSFVRQLPILPNVSLSLDF